VEITHATMPCEPPRKRARGRQIQVTIAAYRPMMSSSSEKSPAVFEALAAISRGERPERSTLREAVRALLADVATKAPGRSVEVRIPPYGAIQCVEGPRHTRGTPPNVVEMDPITFVELAGGLRTWSEAVKDGKIHASGIRADISHVFPITSR